ncbi:MAG: hypothetical protein ACOCRO_02815 [Halanaerobiales bacterium]
MKKFFNQDKIKIKEESEYNEHVFNIDIEELYGTSFYKQLDKEITEFLNNIKDTKTPTLFKIVGDYELLEEDDPFEQTNFYIALISLFIGNMIYEKELDREKRLLPPERIKKLNTTTGIKKKIINNEMMFPNFSIELKNTNGEIVYEVFANENIVADVD